MWIVDRTAAWRRSAPLVALPRPRPSGAEIEDAESRPCGGEWTIAPHNCWRCGGTTPYPLYRDHHICEWCRETGDEPVDRDPYGAVTTGWWKRPRNACLALVDAGTAMAGGTAARDGDAGLVLRAPAQFGVEPLTARFGARPADRRNFNRRIVLASASRREQAVRDFARLLDALEALFSPYRYDAVSKAWWYGTLVFDAGAGEPRHGA